MPEKSWEVELSKDSWKYLEKMGKKASLRILDRLEELGKCANPVFHKGVKPLTGKFLGFYRLRVGNLRAVFELDWREKRIGILAIVQRGSAY